MKKGLLYINVYYTIPRCVLDTTSCDQVCQLLATGRWFSPGTPVSSTNKTDRYDTTEILLKVALNHKLTLKKNQPISVIIDFDLNKVCKSKLSPFDILDDKDNSSSLWFIHFSNLGRGSILDLTFMLWTPNSVTLPGNWGFRLHLIHAVMNGIMTHIKINAIHFYCIQFMTFEQFGS